MTLNHGQSLALEIARSTNWLIIYGTSEKKKKKKKKMDGFYPKFLANGSTWRLFFQCCTTVVTNPNWKFGIKHSRDGRVPKHHSHFQDLHGCTFYECHSRVFVLSNRIKTDFCNDYQDLDWIHACVSEKKGLTLNILSLIVLLIVGGQRQKDISRHFHIIILQKSII